MKARTKHKFMLPNGEELPADSDVIIITVEDKVAQVMSLAGPVYIPIDAIDILPSPIFVKD